ncbi:MAG: hypothetical protein QJR02_01985 [Sinobacteraceae bacterium]|nr:hypothetical protein [Nevskiaceae bacterium]
MKKEEKPRGGLKSYFVLIGVFLALLTVVVIFQPDVYMNLRLWGDQKIVRSGDVIRWCGAIRPSALQQITEAVNQAPSESGFTLVLASNRGGSIPGALAVADHLAELRINKVVAADNCASACGLLWALAPRRVIAEGTSVGFHQPHTAIGQSAADSIRVQTQRMIAAGWPEALVRTFMSVPAGQMYRMGVRDLQERAGVPFEVIPRGEVPASYWCG